MRLFACDFNRRTAAGVYPAAVRHLLCGTNGLNTVAGLSVESFLKHFRNTVNSPKVKNVDFLVKTHVR
jgi:hypothetical protein